MTGMGVGNLNTMGAGTLGMGIPGLSNVTGVTSVGGNIQTGDALTQAYSGIQQYNGKEEHSEIFIFRKMLFRFYILKIMVLAKTVQKRKRRTLEWFCSNMHH